MIFVVPFHKFFFFFGVCYIINLKSATTEVVVRCT